jgi:hypothetical protein
MITGASKVFIPFNSPGTPSKESLPKSRKA